MNGNNSYSWKKCSIPNVNRDLVLIWRDFLHKHSRFDLNWLELENNHRIVRNRTYKPYWYLRKPIFLRLILSIWNRLDRFQIEWMELLPFTSEIFPFPSLPNRVGSWKSVKEAGNGTSSLFASCSEKDARLKNQTQPDVGLTAVAQRRKLSQGARRSVLSRTILEGHRTQASPVGVQTTTTASSSTMYW